MLNIFSKISHLIFILLVEEQRSKVLWDVPSLPGQPVAEAHSLSTVSPKDATTSVLLTGY